MAIIYSYPTVDPVREDLVLGTDVSSSNKATKNFTIQSIAISSLAFSDKSGS